MRTMTGIVASRLKSLLRVLVLALVVCGPAGAIDPQPFDSPEQEERYRALIEELRCLVCQNQNIADSNAGLAKDLRDIVLEKMNEGLSDDEIKAFLQERYGDFVLYNPPVHSGTYALWYGPAVFLLIGFTVYVIAIRRRVKGQVKASPDPDQEELDRRLEELENDQP